MRDEGMKNATIDTLLDVQKEVEKITNEAFAKLGLFQQKTDYEILKLEIEPLILHLKNKIKPDETPVFWIDLFSGAGGTTSGIHLANNENIHVVACVNHDYNAIMSHKANHPHCLHFVEDVRDFNVVLVLKLLVDRLRKEFPGCKINKWASLECTNYSKAKGGLPRDADSRTLANALFMYLELLKPDYLFIENVREFMAWGPLDEKGRPISKLNGRDYIRWINKVKSFGYDYDYQLLNAADFGAYTSRERYFGQFAKNGMPIRWPESTHSKKPVSGGLFEAKKRWKAVRDVLDLDDEGQSIFTRLKPLSDNTLERIFAGLVKYVANGDESFIKRYNGGNPNEKVSSLDCPIGTISTNNRHALVKSTFLTAHYSSGKNIHSIDNPCPTVSTKDRFTKVDARFLIDYQYKSNAHSLDNPSPTLLTKDKLAKTDVKFMTNYYSGGGQLSDINNPNPTLTSIPKQRLTSVLFMDQQYGQSKPASIDDPAGTITANPKQNLVSVDVKHHYLMNPAWGGNSSSVDKPCPVIVARQDKAPMYKITATKGLKIIAIPYFENESEIMRKIKLFMAYYGILDIRMRMLKIIELLRIQGFDENYELIGSKTEQKKFIGNAVVPLVAMMLANANYLAIQKHVNAA